MAVTGFKATFPGKYLLPSFSTDANFLIRGLSFDTHLFKRARSLGNGRFSFVLSKNGSKMTTYCVVQSRKELYSEADQGAWEDHDDGSDSDFDEDNEVEENGMDFESDWKQESDAVATASTVEMSTADDIEEELVRDVEQLLGPEERAILQQNADPNLDKISTAKWKPLHTLALSGQILYMDKLLEEGFGIDSVDKYGHTALHKAIIGKKEAVISHLLRKGANPDVRDRDGASPLHYAVQVGAMQTVKLLIRYKVDVNVSDIEGWTPLHIAVQSRNRDITKILLVNGADKTRRTKDGKTPLDLCLCYGKDFKSYDLAKLVKIVPANRDLRLAS